MRSFGVGGLKGKLLSWITVIAAIALAVSCLYLLYGILAGYIPKYPLFPRPQRVHMLQNIKAMLVAFQISSVLLSALVALAHYDDANKVVLVGLLGAFAYVGVPFISSWALAVHGAPYNYAVKIVSRGFKAAGTVILLIFALPVARMVWLYLREFSIRRVERAYAPTARRVPTKRLTLFSRCWEMPYCRDFLRARCPAYRARRTCWKFGRGCYCDPSIVEGLLEGVKASELVYQEGVTTTRLTITCRKCPIFLEHQRLKYRALSPLVYPATGALMWLLFPFLKALYFKGAALLVALFGRLSYMGPAAFQPWKEALASPFLLGLFVAIAGLLLLMGLIRLTDFLILEVKI